MRNRDCGATLCSRIQGCLHDLLALGIQCRGRFVKKEDLRIAQKGTGDGNTLFLATGEQSRFAADRGSEAVTFMVSMKTWTDDEGRAYGREMMKS